MEEFERAILCFFDPKVPEQIKRQADEYCKQVRCSLVGTISSLILMLILSFKIQGDLTT